MLGLDVGIMLTSLTSLWLAHVSFYLLNGVCLSM